MTRKKYFFNNLYGENLGDNKSRNSSPVNVHLKTQNCCNKYVQIFKRTAHQMYYNFSIKHALERYLF